MKTTTKQREEKQLKTQDLTAVFSRDAVSELLPQHLKLVPQLNEIYELRLAFYENLFLSDEELIRNGAYFSKVGDTLTRHFLMCKGEPLRVAQHSSSRLKSFFTTNLFKTGYATHGLFPYRGKFHPQMIKALINIMGLKPGDLVLDPMMGSGTVLIEACLMGINSIGIDASPFCQFMSQAKLDGLTVPLTSIECALENRNQLFEYFLQLTKNNSNRVMSNQPQISLDFFPLLEGASRPESLQKHLKIDKVHNFLLLAFLDSVGYSTRSNRKSLSDHFKAILDRYYHVSKKIQTVLKGVETELAEVSPLTGDARELHLESDSVDGIIFSPPYSFAIDYLENDSPHLEFLGVDTDLLRDSMVGLRGKTKRKRLDYYNDDMEKILSECSRVLKPGHICTIVVGTNNNQLSKILRVNPHQVKGIDEILIELGSLHGFRLLQRIERQITGMANTMRTEYIIMLVRDSS